MKNILCDTKISMFIIVILGMKELQMTIDFSSDKFILQICFLIYLKIIGYVTGYDNMIY